MTQNITPMDAVNDDIDWTFPVLQSPPCGVFLWNAASNFTMCTIGTIAKLLLLVFNRTRCYNVHKLNKILSVKPSNVPLVTVSNHISRFDDPGIWACLQYRFFNHNQMRWSIVAHDICFTTKIHSYFFLLGKCIPVIRGRGVYQKAVDFSIEQLRKGGWVHLFPEGRINMDHEVIRFKWGVGRMIYESPVTPIVIPICNIGMDSILPMYPPYIPSFGKRVTINFGDPIDFTELLRDLRKSGSSAEEARRALTERIQNETDKLKKETETLHNADQ